MKNLIGLFSENGINGILIEYGDRFPFTGDVAIARNHNFTYNPEDIELFIKTAVEKNVEMIPC